MATLNDIAYNIKELMSGGDTNIENSISVRQIKHWIHYHRAKIIEEKILAGAPINRRWVQPISSYLLNISNEYDLHGNVSIAINDEDFIRNRGFANNEYYGENYLPGNEFEYFIRQIKIPSTINVGNHDGLTNIRIKKRIAEVSRAASTTRTMPPEPISTSYGQWSSWDKISPKTIDEAQFAWANKFTKIKNPYVVPYVDNQGTVLEVAGLRAYPKKNDITREYQYFMEIYGILQDPTKSRFFAGRIAGVMTFNDYTDSNSIYPISDVDLPLLVSRVAEIEMNLILKTPIDLTEDNVDTSKISMGGGQQQ
jgi:hypothetical protein